MSARQSASDLSDGRGASVLSCRGVLLVNGKDVSYEAVKSGGGLFDSDSSDNDDVESSGIEKSSAAPSRMASALASAAKEREGRMPQVKTFAPECFLFENLRSRSFRSWAFAHRLAKTERALRCRYPRSAPRRLISWAEVPAMGPRALEASLTTRELLPTK